MQWKKITFQVGVPQATAAVLQTGESEASSPRLCIVLRSQHTQRSPGYDERPQQGRTRKESQRGESITTRGGNSGIETEVVTNPRTLRISCVFAEMPAMEEKDLA